MPAIPVQTGCQNVCKCTEHMGCLWGGEHTGICLQKITASCLVTGNEWTSICRHLSDLLLDSAHAPKSDGACLDSSTSFCSHLAAHFELQLPRLGAGVSSGQVLLAVVSVGSQVHNSVPILLHNTQLHKACLYHLDFPHMQ